MDFREFRSKKIWIPIEFGPEDARAKFEVAYAPGEINDTDLQWLSAMEHMRLAAFVDEDDRPTVENRSQRRANQRDSSRTQDNDPKKRDIQEYMDRLIVDWTLLWPTDDDPQAKLPITRESFDMMEIGLRVEIVGSIMRDYLNRPQLGNLSALFSGATMSGPTGRISASTPSNGAVDSSPGTLQAAPKLEAVPSGSTG